jgi:general secretion pathway protein C
MSTFDSSTIFKSSKGVARPPLEGMYIYLFTALLGYSAADLSVLYYRPQMLNTQAPPTAPVRKSSSKFVSRGSYAPITQRNIFSETGNIPPALSAQEKPKQNNLDAPAVLSSLPMKLLGTIVHVNPAKSVASVLLSNRNKAASFKKDDKIESMAKVLKVERRKLTFINLNNQIKEYIEIPEDLKISFAKPAEKTPTKDTVVQKRGKFDFTVKRTDLDKYTSNLAKILRDARMVPNIPPGSGGAVQGFRFVSIKPDSIFNKLGFKVGDVIKSVEGEPVNSPTKAMELYNVLKKSDRVALGVEREGREEEFNYTVE